MTPAEVLSEAKARGIVFIADGSTLRIGARSGVLTPALHARILALKPELLALLRSEAEDEVAARARDARAWRTDFTTHMAKALGYSDDTVRVALELLGRQPAGRTFQIGKDMITIEMGDGLAVRVHRTPQPWATALRDGDTA